jgi:hypothetical protein
MSYDIKFFYVRLHKNLSTLGCQQSFNTFDMKMHRQECSKLIGNIFVWCHERKIFCSSDLKLGSIIKANPSHALIYLAFHAIESTLLLNTQFFSVYAVWDWEFSVNLPFYR